MHATRRVILMATAAAASLALSGCANLAGRSHAGAGSQIANAPPVVFVHGNGDTAALWQTTLWRFESNGWPRERLHAIQMPFPLSRDDDSKAQAGRSSTAEHMAYLKAEVAKVLKATGANKVVLVANSRGGYAVRNYIANGGGDTTVSHAILGGTPNHGVWSIPGFREANEFSGTGPFLSALNAPKNAQGDEVIGPVQWMTIRSDNNDKYAQPDGVWIGQKGKPTGVGFDGPALKGAHNVVIARLDHRETAFSQAAFNAMFSFITGKAPTVAGITPEKPVRLSGLVTGLGADPLNARSGNFNNNLPLPGAQLHIYATDAATGARVGPALLKHTVSANGEWGPVTTSPDTPLEFVLSAPGYATTHIYRSPFPRSSNIVHLRPERMAEADKSAASVVTMSRPRGYLDPARDTMLLDGVAPPGVPPGAGGASAKVKPAGGERAISAEFNGERVTGRTWPASAGDVVVLELTY